MVNSLLKTKFSDKTIETSLAILGIGFIVIALAGHLVFLTSSPPVFIDEPWYANAAWNWLRNGVNFDTMHAGTYDQFGFEWVRWPTLGNVPWLLSFAIFGLSLFSTRIVSWLFGIVLLIAVYYLGKYLYGKWTGLLAALLLVLSPPYYQASHYGRPDIMLSAAGIFSFILVLKAFEKEKWYLHLAAGLCASLAFDIHPNALLYMLGIAVLYFFQYRKKFFLSSGTWWVVLGGSAGLLYFAISHIFPNPSTYFALYNLSLGNTHRLPIYPFDVLKLLQSLRDEVGRYHFIEYGLEFGLIGASLIFVTIRRAAGDRKVLLFIGTILGGFVALIGSKHDIYAIILYPFFMILSAETLRSLIRNSKAEKLTRVFLSALLFMVVFNNSEHFVRQSVNHRNYDYYAITEKIREVVPPGSRVMALPNWWLGLADYDFRSSLNLTFYHFLNGLGLEQGMAKIDPEYVIVDRGQRGLLVEDAFKNASGFDMYYLPQKNFEQFLSENGQRILEFYDPWHGDFQIYKIVK